MSHVISSQPSATSPYQPTAMQEGNGAQDNPPRITGNNTDQGQDDCCFNTRNRSGFCSLLCKPLSLCCQGIRNCTESCCEGCANCLTDCCEDKPRDRNRRRYNRGYSSDYDNQMQIGIISSQDLGTQNTSEPIPSPPSDDTSGTHHSSGHRNSGSHHSSGHHDSGTHHSSGHHDSGTHHSSGHHDSGTHDSGGHHDSGTCDFSTADSGGGCDSGGGDGGGGGDSGFD